MTQGDYLEVERQGAWAKAEVAALLIFWIQFLNGAYRQWLHSPVLFWSIDVVEFVIVPTAIILYLASKRGFALAEIGIRRPPQRSAYIRYGFHALCMFLLFVLVHGAIVELSAYVDFGGFPPTKSGSKMPSDPWLKRLTIVYMSISAAYLEETTYRGILQHALLRRNVSPPVIITVVSCLFAIIHWENGIGDMLEAFFIGFLASAYVTKYKSLIAVYVAHAAYDWFTFTMIL